VTIVDMILIIIKIKPAFGVGKISLYFEEWVLN
jgi:hypothetical protein